ncbi:hypothetical protein ABL78_6109, partial [Leptomonas seymouri]
EDPVGCAATPGPQPTRPPPRGAPGPGAGAGKPKGDGTGPPPAKTKRSPPGAAHGTFLHNSPHRHLVCCSEFSTKSTRPSPLDISPFNIHPSLPSFFQKNMQTKLSDFTARNQHPESLPFVGANDSGATSHKRSRSTDYAETYPLRSTVSRSVRVNLQLLDSRIYSRHYVRILHAARAHLRSSFSENITPTVRQVTSSVHLNRTNEDGEPLLSSVDTFNNCITDVVWDPKNEFFIAARRSCFQLFGATALLYNNAQSPEDTVTPLLNLKTETVRARLGAENRISFGFSTTHFLGNALHTICGYSGVAKVDVFDLEYLDEETGEPLRSFSLNSIFPHEEHNSNSSFPSTTAIVTLSDTLALAALSNGCSVFLDTRISKPVICTRIVNQSEIISASSVNTSRSQKRRCNTAIDVINRGCNAQLIVGAKNGLVDLWDLRKCDLPVAATAVCGAVEAIKSVISVSPARCGAPLVWLNTECGDIMCFNIGAASIEEISSVRTKDARRSQSSASLAPPKISVMEQDNLLIYPCISLNTVLFYNIGDSDSDRIRTDCKSTKSDETRREGVNIASCTANGEFKSAREALYEQGSLLGSSASSLVERNIKQHSPTLLQSLPFHEWSHQISCVSAATRHEAVVVGGDDGDIHLLLGSSI